MKKRSFNHQLSFSAVSKTAHELRSPLVAIQGYLSLIEEDGAKLDVSQKKYLHRAMESVHKSLLLVDCVLDINSVDQRSSEIKLQPIRLDPITRQVKTEFSDKLTKAKISFKHERTYRLPLVLASRSHIIQVIRHIFSYIVDYAKKGNLRVHFRNREGKLIVKITVDFLLPVAQAASGEIPLSARDIELYMAQYLSRITGAQLNYRIFPASSTTFYISIPLAHQLKLSV